MPSERHRSKEDTWSTNELKRALNKDEIRKERERLKRERREGRGDDEEIGRSHRRKEEGHHRRNEDDDHKERRRHHDDDKRRHRDRDDERRSHKEIDEDERERQRRERREKREGKSSKDTREREQSRKRDEDDDVRHRDKRSRDHDDRRRKEDDEEEKERRREEERERRRREREKDRDKRHKDRDRDERGGRDRNGETEDRHRSNKDEERRREKKDRHREEDDEKDRRKDRRRREEDEDDRRKDRRHKERDEDDEEEERERQRRERREKRERKDKDGKRRDEDEDERRRRKEKERQREREEEERRERERQERHAKERKKAEEEDNPYDEYEDDFEDYEEDFEDEEEEKPPPSSRKVKSPELHRSKPHGAGKAFDYADSEMDEVLRALDEENDRLLTESRQGSTPETSNYRREEYGSRFGEDEGGWGSTEPFGESQSFGLINFSSAKQRVMRGKANSKTAKRAADLLQMLDLDVARYDMFDLPPVKEYELYIRSFGRTDTQQAYVQTNDDNIDRDLQTDDIDYRQKWTQHPPEDFMGCGRGDGEKDLDEEEESQQNKQQDLSRLNKFVEKAGQVIAILLDEEKELQRRSEDVNAANRSNMAVSEGFTNLSVLTVLKDRYVEFAHFSPAQPNYLLTVYSKPTQFDEGNPVCSKGIICVWNTNEPSYPQRILACESQPVCCCFSPYKTTLVFAGMVDGSVCAWDLREPISLHHTVQYDQSDHVLRYPTYNTAGVMDAENHHSPVTTLNPVTSSTEKDSAGMDSADDSLGLSFQLVSCEEQGVVNFWVVAEISNPDMAGSEVDLGLSPGGRIKLVRSSTITLQSPVSKGNGSLRSFELQLSPKDPNHYYVGTEGGYILHGLRFGSRAFPRTFSAITDAPADVTCIDFSPFGQPCFLASSADGGVHLFHSKTDVPLVTWPSKVWGSSHVRCVRWSRSRPCVFYILDDASHLYTFDVLEGDTMPAKIETLSSSDRAICISFTTDHRLDTQEGHTGRLPQMLVSYESGAVQIHTISKEYREQQTLEEDFLPSYLARF